MSIPLKFADSFDNFKRVGKVTVFTGFPLVTR